MSHLGGWRIYKRKHAASAFTGEGARLFGGRWNSRGVAVVYTAASPSLAALEMLVHLESDEVLRHYRIREVRFDERHVERVDVRKLPRTWRRGSGPLALKRIGDAWVAEARSLVLAVPSAVSPLEVSYLINPAHPAAKTLEFGNELPYRYDTRLA